MQIRTAAVSSATICHITQGIHSVPDAKTLISDVRETTVPTSLGQLHDKYHQNVYLFVYVPVRLFHASHRKVLIPDAQMSALGDFAKEQKSKTGIGGVSLSQSFSSFGEGIKSKLSNPLSMLSRSETADDTQLLTEDSSSGDGGQLPFSRNRKSTSGGWLGPFSSDVNMCGLSRMQRIIAFFMFAFGAGFCFMTSMMLLPVLVLQTRKFAALNTLGSTLLLISFSFLWGPSAYLQHLLSPQRRIVTISYIATVVITLYTSLWTIRRGFVRSFGRGQNSEWVLRADILISAVIFCNSNEATTCTGRSESAIRKAKVHSRERPALRERTDDDDQLTRPVGSSLLIVRAVNPGTFLWCEEIRHVDLEHPAATETSFVFGWHPARSSVWIDEHAGLVLALLLGLRRVRLRRQRRTRDSK
uniref:Vesicle transport protein n=1 Tax=Steinernema glaseri TaxID=37863 RepID=A0A1I7Z685_9BILA